MTSPSDIGICVVGTGRAGMIHARNFDGQVPGARVAAVADAVEESLAAAAEALAPGFSHADYREAIRAPGVDAVLIATPTAYHREIAVAAAETGKHVFCEKPMAMNVAECDDMIRAAGKAGVKLQIGFMRRFDHGFRAAKRQMDAGAIGDVVAVKSLTHGPSTPKRWMYDLEKSNGPLAEVNSHDIDTLRWFTGSEFRQVYAVAGNYRCPDARDEFPDFYDNVSLVASFTNGMQGFIGGAVAVGYGYDARVEIVGAKGVLFVGRRPERDLVAAGADGEPDAAITASWRDLFSHAYLAEDKAFVRSIVDDVPPVVGGLDGKRAVEVVNAGNRSIREGIPITL